MVASSVTSAVPHERRGGRAGLRPPCSARNKGPGHVAASLTKRMMKKWEVKETIDLSRMVYSYKVLHGHLPSDMEFWLWSCRHFKGRFTTRQVREKVYRLKLRYQHLASGRAKAIKVGEREIFNIWNMIMTLNISAPPPPPAMVPPHTTPPGSPAPHLVPPTSPPSTPSLSSSAQPPPMQVVAEDIEVRNMDQAASEEHLKTTHHPPRSSYSLHDDLQGETTPDVHPDGCPTHEPEEGDEGVEEGGGIGAEAQCERGSTCLSSSKMGQQNKFGHGGFGTCHNVKSDNDMASDRAPYVTLLHHTTIADLASTTKALAEATRTLTEIVQSHGPLPSK